ncbi:putative imidazolonepropionase isoform X5 [Opisthocomus hoazin]|uniref:putative imidazolonepropionase isoform X5 n=1 Tax=Opisthocomus hoazin TaxID=30419 RepID=UPI003F53ABC5
MAVRQRLLLENAQQLVLVCGRGEECLRREAASSAAVLRGASLVVGLDGCIKAVGQADAIRSQFSGATFERVIDCSGKCVLPGLVDAHTHPVWAGDRVHEFAMKSKRKGRRHGKGRSNPSDCFSERGKTATEAADDIINNHLPKLKELKLSGEIDVDNIDVFCEKGVFDLETTRRILQAGKDTGLQMNFHGDELHPMKAAELGAELGARAISHLEEVSEEGIRAMARANCAAVLLPTTAYMLRLKQPQARKMLEEGVIVALGSDFNPNAYCFSMPMVMHLACVNMKMSMNEALAAATINAAYALGKSDTHGSIETGKQGDLVIITSPRWEHLIYQFGGHEALIDYVIVKGKVVYQNERCGTISSY